MLVIFQIAETIRLAASYLAGVTLAGTHNRRLILALAAVACFVVLIMVAATFGYTAVVSDEERRDEALSVLQHTHDKDDAEHLHP